MEEDTIYKGMTITKIKKGWRVNGHYKKTLKEAMRYVDEYNKVFPI